MEKDLKKFARIVEVQDEEGKTQLGMEIPKDVLDGLNVVDGQIFELIEEEDKLVLVKTQYVYNGS